MWDMFWFQCNYWLIPLFFVIFYVYGQGTYGLGIALVFVLVRLTHGYITHYICVSHPGFKEVSKKKPWLFFGIPGLITLGFVIYFFIPQSVYPYTTYERLEFYYFVAFPYIYVHYAGQHIGIFSMYRAKAKQKLSPFHKKFEKVYCHVVVSLVLTALNLTNYYDHVLAGVKWGDIFLVEHLSWNILAWIIVIPMALVFVFLELKTENRSWPKIIYGISLAVMSVVLSFQDFVFAWVLIHMQHFLSHFGLCGHMLVNYDRKEGRTLTKISTAKKYAALVLVSITIAVIHYRYQIVGSISGRYDVLFKNLVPLADPESFLRTLILGIFVGLGICHYWYDRLAFRFSDPEISEVLKKYL